MESSQGSVGMNEIAAEKRVEAVERRGKTNGARPESDTWTEFRGVYRLRRGGYGASIWDQPSRTQVWLGSFGTAEDAARAYDAARSYDAAAVKLPRARKKTAPRTESDAAGTGFRGVYRLSSGVYGASIWDQPSRTQAWLGTFRTVEDAAGAVKLAGAGKKRDPSKFRGVYWTGSGRYGALTTHSKGKERTWLGTFRAAEDAARAYDAAAVKLHGARAVTNFGPDGGIIPGTQHDDHLTAEWRQVEELLKDMDYSTDDKVALIDAAAVLHQIALAGRGHGGRPEPTY